MNGIYPLHLLDHYKRPRCWGALDTPDFVSEVKHPSCGDKIQLCGTVADGRVSAVAFRGSGCIISQAAASLLMELCVGKSIEEILAISDERMQELVGIALGPVRLKCVLLSRDALVGALAKIFKS